MNDFFLAELQRIGADRLTKFAADGDTTSIPESMIVRRLVDHTHFPGLHKRDQELSREMGIKQKVTHIYKDTPLGGFFTEKGILGKRSMRMFRQLGLPIRRKDQAYIVAPEDSMILAHELGHAAASEGGRFSRTVHNARMAQGRLAEKLPLPAAMAVSAAPVLAASALAFKSGPVGRYGPAAIMAALQAPILINEADASLRGGKGLRKIKATKEQMAKYRAAMLGAYATYLTAAAGAVATPYLPKLYARILREAAT